MSGCDRKIPVAVLTGFLGCADGDGVRDAVDEPARLLYISLFGTGSIIGMAAISGADGASLGMLARPSVLRGLALVIRARSIAVMRAIDMSSRDLKSA